MIRKATPADDYEIAQLLIRMHGESPEILPKLDAYAVQAVIDDCISDGVCFVLEGEGFEDLAGVIMGNMETESYWWNPGHKLLVLGDHAFYVVPWRRSFANAKALVKAFVGEGRRKGADKIRLGHMHAARDLDALYSRLGGRKTGSLFDFT